MKFLQHLLSFCAGVRVPVGVGLVLAVLALGALAAAAPVFAVPAVEDTAPSAGGAAAVAPRNALRTASQTATPPGAPENLSAAWRSGEVSLSWEAPASDGGSAITGYEYRYRAGGAAFRDTWTETARPDTIAVDGLINGVAHTFEVRAVNAAGVGSGSSVKVMPLAPREGDIRVGIGTDDAGVPEVLVNNNWGKVCDDDFTRREAGVACRQLGFSSGKNVPTILERISNSSGYAVQPGPLWFAMDDVHCTGGEGRLFDCQHRSGHNCFGFETLSVQCDTTGLGPPRNVTFIPGSEQGVLVWNAPAQNGGAHIVRYEYRYRVANQEFGSWNSVGRDLMATVANPSEGFVYLFEVRAVNTDGAQAVSTTVSGAVINGFSLVDAGTNKDLLDLHNGAVIALGSYDQDNLTIRAKTASGAVGSMQLKLTGTQTQSRTENSTPWSLYGDDDDREEPQFEGSGLAAGSYQIMAIAYAADDLGGAQLDTLTMAFTATVLAPEAPENLSADWASDQLTFSWEAPASDGGAAITGYQHRHQAGSGAFTAWSEASADLATTIPSVADGAAYTFEVRAVNAIGTGDAASLTTPVEPGKPQDLAVTRGSGQATLSWAPPANNGGATITGYQYRHRARAEEFSSWTSAGMNLDATVGDLTDGVAYFFEVRASNSSGAGAPASVNTAAITGFTLLQAKSDTELLPLADGTVVVPGDYHTRRFAIRVDVNPTVVVGGMELRLTGPQSRANTENSARWFLLGGNRVVGVNLDGGTYRLMATAYSGPLLSGPHLDTLAVEFTVVAHSPGPPKRLSAVWRSGEVALFWEAPDNDGGYPVTGYEYRYHEYSYQRGGTPFPDTWTKTTLPNTISVAGLTNGFMYVFEVRAVNTAGRGSAARVMVVPLADQEGDVRITKGEDYRGPVEVYINGTWGKVCDDMFRDVGARVACGQLGFSGGSESNDDDDLVGVPFVMDNVDCSGDEERLIDCPYLTEFDCDGSETVHVLCVVDDLGPPRNATYVPGYGQGGTLVWNPPARNGGAPIGRYDYRYKPADGEFGDWTPAGRNLAATIPNLTRDATYVFEVRAVNEHGAEAIATTPIAAANVPCGLHGRWPQWGPYAPQNLSAHWPGNQLTMSWEFSGCRATDYTHASLIFGYQHRYRVGSGDFTEWSETGQHYAVTIPNVADGAAYTFEVRGVGTAGPGYAAGYAAGLTTPAAPSIPQDLRVTHDGAEATLTWTAPAYNGGASITGYQYRRLTVGQGFSEWTDAGSDPTLAVPGPEQNARFFEIRATNSANQHSKATSVSDAEAGLITGFTLVEDGNQSNSLDLVNGATVVLADYGVNDFGIRVNLSSESIVEKVELERSGADVELGGADVETHRKTEWWPPYSLYGDNGPDDLHGESLAIGWYNLSATVYGRGLPSGATLGKLEIFFSVVADHLTPLQQVSVPNTRATGQPTIGGQARVGETLTADVSGITDDDGLDSAVFSYQWLRGGAEIAGATGDTYALVSEDEGRTIEVRVSFTDAQGNAESLTSDATGAVTPAAGPLAGFSLVADGTGVELLALVEGVQVVTGEYSASSFAIRANLTAGETVGSVRFQLVRDGMNVTANGSKTESYAPYSLYGDAGENSLTGAPLPEGSYLLTATAHSDRNAGGETLGLLEVSFTVVETAPVPGDTPAQQQQQEPAPISSATGAPAIDGNARVGETLTADTSGIADDDGLDNVVFAYQWTRSDGNGDTDISGANGSSYTLVEADEGQTIKVTVTFTDEAGNAESVTSDPTGEVDARPNSRATGAPAIDGITRVGGTLTADTSGIEDDDGLDSAAFAYQWLRGDAEIVGATGSSYTLVAEDEGQTIKVQVSFTDDQGHAESLTSDPTGEVEARPNTLATGAPTIDGIVRVGQTLTADTSGISDDDGLTNVAFGYQWIRGSTGITGATGSSYTLVEADEGKTVKVRVSFTDDRGNPETLTSDATGVAEAAETVPGRPQDLDGEASAQGIALTWQAPSGSSVARYVVYRGILQNGSMNGRPMTEHATVAATSGAMAYTDAAVESGQEYRYRVAAVNSAGEGRKSGWVNVRAGS